MNKYDVLKKYFGYSEFREKQSEIIDSILNKNDTMAILPTGGGKSLCYQIPAILFDGLTIVVSPLISLMKDQVDALKTNGISAVFVNSSLSVKQQADIFDQILKREITLMYIAPERLQSEWFLDVISRIKVSFVAIDEAHCISQWGHDFRKSYLMISEFIQSLPSKPVVGAFTATATPQVKDDIISKLNFSDSNVFISGFDRKNLKFSVVMGENGLQFIKKYIKSRSDESGIIYASTRKEVEKIYEELLSLGYNVAKYHAGMPEKEKRMFQEEFIYDRLTIMVATNAFGMGIDKSNVRYVIHNNMPKDLESYYQEAGRAGRDGNDSEVILVYNARDIVTQNYFIDKNRDIVSLEQVQMKKEKLNSMVNYCHTTGCLRGYILNYFGDKNVSKECSNCSNCLNDVELIDETENAQKIVSCIFKLPYSFGIKIVVDVLRGSKRKEILSRNLDDLSTYGIMSEYSAKKITEIINSLIGNDYLEISSGQYPVVSITNKGLVAVKNREKIFRKVLKVNDFIEKFDSNVVEKLKELRRKIAAKEGVPPYIVFNDKALNDLAIKLPFKKEELLAVKGFGEVKADKYGNEIFNVVREFRDHRQCALQNKIHKRKKSKNKSSKESIALFVDGMTINDIAITRGLSEQTIEVHVFDNIEDVNGFRIRDFVDENQEKKIRDIVEADESLRLAEIKSKLPDYYTYTMIKAVRCQVRLEKIN